MSKRDISPLDAYHVASCTLPFLIFRPLCRNIGAKMTTVYTCAYYACHYQFHDRKHRGYGNSFHPCLSLSHQCIDEPFPVVFPVFSKPFRMHTMHFLIHCLSLFWRLLSSLSNLRLRQCIPVHSVHTYLRF